MSYRKKNLKGLLFFNILHFNTGLIVIGLIVIALYSLFFAHSKMRENEKGLSEIMISSIEDRENSLPGTVKEILAINDQFENNKEKQEVFGEIMKNRNIDSFAIYDKSKIDVKLVESSGNNKEKINKMDGKDLEEHLKKNLKKNNTAYCYSEGDSIIYIYRANDDNYVVFILDKNFFPNLNNGKYMLRILNENHNQIFSSQKVELSKEHRNEIIDSTRDEDDNRYLYRKDKNSVVFSGYIEDSKISNIKIVIEHDISEIFNPKYWIIYFVGVIIIGVLSAITLTIKIFKIIKEHLNLIKGMLDKVGKGKYNFTVPAKYQMKEWISVFNKIATMSKSIREREHQLSMYNQELMDAHESIESMYKKLKSTDAEKRNQFIEVIASMLNLIELKDEYTAGHSKAVTQYAGIIAREMNTKHGYRIDEDKLRVGSILHDIGKIGIDENVLNKPSRLNRDEYEIIKSHPSNGAKAIKGIQDFQIELAIIELHHEKYDGTGYPNGLKGDEIPMEARIVSVADAFDAMTSNRPYRNAMTSNEAIVELVKCKGTQFDPKVVDVMVTLIKMNKIDIIDDRKNIINT